MPKALTVDAFLAADAAGPILDVRAPVEFARGLAQRLGELGLVAAA